MLKYQVDKLDGVDEAIAPLYKEAEGGGYVLQVEGVVPATQVTEYKQKLVDANEEAKRRRQANEKWLELGESPDAVRELLNAKGKPNTDHEAIISEMKKGHAAELDAANGKLRGVLSKAAMSDLKAQIAGAGIIPGGIEPLALMARERLTFDSDGNLRIMSADGSKPLAGSGADGYATVADLAKELAASETGQLFIKAGGVSGGGKAPASGNGNPSQTTVTRTQFDGMSHSQRAAFAKDGGKVVDA